MIGIIIVIIIILQLLNYAQKQKAENQKSFINNTGESVQYNYLDLSTNKSVLSGEEISRQKKDSIKIIDEFFAYCN